MALATTLLFYAQEKNYHLFFDTQLKMQIIPTITISSYKKVYDPRAASHQSWTSVAKLV